MCGKYIAKLAIVVVVAISSADAVPIGPGDFGPGAVMESFEGLSAGTNLRTYPQVGEAHLFPGDSGPYQFSSGVVLSEPIPNPTPMTCPGYFNSVGVAIGDFAFGDASARLLWNSIESESDVAFGTAYLISGGDYHEGSVEFTFPTDMLRVGVYLSGGNDQASASVFDASGVLLEKVYTDTGGRWC